MALESREIDFRLKRDLAPASTGSFGSSDRHVNLSVVLMVLGMGACAGGIVMGLRVPVLLTSRSQGAADRLASAALGVIAANGKKGAQA